MAGRKSNKAGPPLTKEQLGGANPKVVAAFLAFAEKLGHKVGGTTNKAESLANTRQGVAEMKADVERFRKSIPEQDID